MRQYLHSPQHGQPRRRAGRYLRRGSYPAWRRHRQYVAGAHVLFRGEPYEAKWQNQGVSPAGSAGDQSASPRKPLFRIPGEPAS
jgi:hypothetical protein